MPRFVLLRHECPPEFEKPSHWDLMLEHQEVLRTWELRTLPAPWANALGIEASSEEVIAHPLPDHRLAYLQYEGPLTDNRGSVHRLDRGSYELLREEPALLRFSLQGTAIQGTFQLSRQQDEWTLAEP